jgi:transcriptional regulator with XRE-family HTH domain
MAKTAGQEMVETIRRAVAECGLSLNELGRRTDVNQAQLSRFMRGERTLTLPAAARVCAALGLRLTSAPTSGRQRETS